MNADKTRMPIATQTCFMSSLDLHTHATYQMMLPESIAIVVAPTKEPRWASLGFLVRSRKPYILTLVALSFSVGVFRLTDPPGLETVMTCTERGAFHPHPRGIDIYTVGIPAFCSEDCVVPHVLICVMCHAKQDSDKEYGHVHLVRDLEVEVHDLR